MVSIKIRCPVCGNKIIALRRHIKLWHPELPIKRLNDEIQRWVSTDGNGMIIPSELLHLLANLDWSIRD